MNAPLPDFQPGAILTAADLNTMKAHVAALQQRLATTSAASSRPRRHTPARGQAFQLSSMNGLIHFRQGWIQLADGYLQQVGEQEWNPIAPLRECTIYLEIDPGGTSIVVAAPYDDSTPESNFRRRLGYVRKEILEREGTTMPIYFCVQCTSGLIYPYAPRRQAGTTDPKNGAAFRKSDWGLIYQHAGAVTGSGYTSQGRQYRSAPILGYSCSMREVELPASHGGSSWIQALAFECSI